MIHNEEDYNTKHYPSCQSEDGAIIKADLIREELPQFTDFIDGVRINFILENPKEALK